MTNSVNQVLLADGTRPDDEPTLLDLMTFARRHLLALLGGALLGVVLGLAAAYALPTEWEAVARLRVAQLGGAPPVELPLRVVDRIMQKSFAANALKRMGFSLDESNSKASLLRDNLKVTVAKSDLVGVRVRGASLDEVERFAAALIAELAGVHAKMAAPTLQRWRNEIQDIDMELSHGDREVEQLRASLERQSRVTQATSLYQSVLTNNILYWRETELRGLRERKRVILEQLSPERTFPTAPLGGIEVSVRPGFPKKSLFAVGGLVIGLFMGVLLSVLSSGSARRNVQNAFTDADT